jgi:hypothetical protein
MQQEESRQETDDSGRTVPDLFFLPFPARHSASGKIFPEKKVSFIVLRVVVKGQG